MLISQAYEVKYQGYWYTLILGYVPELAIGGSLGLVLFVGSHYREHKPDAPALPRCRSHVAWHTYDGEQVHQVQPVGHRALWWEIIEGVTYGDTLEDEGLDKNYSPSQKNAHGLSDKNRWACEWHMFQEDNAILDMGRAYAYADEHDRRAHRFLHEQGLALDASKGKPLDVVRAYKAAWTRYRGTQLDKGCRANGFQWLTKAQWAAVEDLYAEALGCFGVEYNGRPAIARHRLNDGKVRQWSRAALRRYFDHAPVAWYGV